MSGFCGWIEGSRTSDAHTTLARMASGLPVFTQCRSDALVGEGAGLASRGDLKASTVASTDGIWASIEGGPRWIDAGLAATAKSEGDAAALIAAWRRFGSNVCAHLYGAFAFAVIDRERRKAVCAIDRAGIHTLCWAQSPSNGLVFGSTTDAVRAHDGVATAIDPLAIFSYLYFVDRIPAPATIYRRMHKLQPGEMLTFDAGLIEVCRYWQISYVPASESDNVLARELRDTLKQAVARSVEPSTAIGAFLSGGLDSSTVTGLLAECVRRPKVFTIGFEDHRFDESAYARIAAEHFNMDHHVLTLRPAHVLNAIEAIVGIYDEPFGNSSVVPTYHCALAAREAGVEVMLAGDGGDELFAGNERYLKDRVFQQYRRLPVILRKLIVEPLFLRLPSDSSIAPIRKAAKYVRLARQPVAVRATLSNIFAQLRPDRVLTTDFLAEIDLDAPRRHVSQIFDELPAASDLQRILYLDHRLTLADSDLRKVNRMCELAGVRVHYPMLDDDVVGFSARVPSELLCKGGRLRGFYKDAFRDFLPAQILNKQKHGFGLPYVQFLSSDSRLRDLCCDSLESLAGHGYFRRDFLSQLTDRTRRGEEVDGTVWDLMILSMWLESRRSFSGAPVRQRALAR